MNKKRFCVFLTVCLLLLSLLSSCKMGRACSCEEALTKMLAVSGEAVADGGRIYLSDADEGELEYLAPEDIENIYGCGANSCFEKIAEYALYTSARAPGEIAVFRCHSSTDTREVAQMCLERSDMLKVALRGTQWREKAGDIRVSINGRYVLLTFTENNRKIEEMFIGML